RGSLARQGLAYARSSSLPCFSSLPGSDTKEKTMKVTRFTAVIVCCFVYSSAVLPQQKATTADPKSGQTQSRASTAPPRAPLTFGLAEDTPVRIRLARTMSSQDARVDDRVDFEVLEDVKVGEVVVIERGATAIA